MDAAPIHKHGDARPEARFQKEVIDYLTARGWYIKVLSASTYMTGMPDLFATHPRYGVRLIECKYKERGGDLFTEAQKATFPKLFTHGCPVVVIDAINFHTEQWIITNVHTYPTFAAKHQPRRPRR